MTENKLVSVVIPCYNHGAYLPEALDSVRAQSYPDFEIIVVNDGSTDPETRDVLHSLDQPDCKVLHTDNQGLPAARNNGIRAALGEYICCLDADDRYHPEYFRKAVAILAGDREKRYGAVPSWVRFFGDSDILWKTVGSNTPGFAPFLQGLRNNIQSATMFRRECWERIGGFDESMTAGYEDWDFWIKMLDLGYKWYCLEEPLIYYRRQEGSMVTRADEQRGRLLETLIRNNHSFYVKHLVPMLVARDREVLDLQQDNKTMAARLTDPERDKTSGNLCGKAAPAGKLQRLLRKLFSSRS